VEHGPVAPQCDHEVGCITCGDTAVPMRVVRLDETRGLALCADAEGARETVETSLVEGVEEGATLLVHAAVALQRLRTEELDAA
jgi:hydrogenase maturation factor